MARSLYTPDERRRLCEEARRKLRENIRFSDICGSLNLNPRTLRKWLNDAAFDRIYPKVHNQGHLL